MNGYDIDRFYQELEDAEQDDIAGLRHDLVLLAQLINKRVNQKVVHLSLKNEWYVYANYSDNGHAQTFYVGKHIDSQTRQAKIAHMSQNEPHPKQFRLSDKKAKELRDNGVWVDRYQDDSHPIKIDFQYNYPQYKIAVEKHNEALQWLDCELSEVAQTDRIAGLMKLERLQSSGYWIEPLDYP